MQTKQLILLITIATALSTILIFPTHAVGEEGTGTLNVYTNQERTTLATTDAEGRYVTAPGTEYYLSISEITEYNIGTSITIWVYRTNTAENIEIGNFEVNTELDAIFTWTIPDNWLDEVAKIKYGTNLENDWLFAQKEIWVNARVGTGILYVYKYTWGGEEADLTEDKHYLVLYGETYYFNISGIEEKYTYEVDGVKKTRVWARYRNTDDPSIGELPIETTPSEIKFVKFTWQIPDWLPIDTQIKFKYGKSPTGDLDEWVYARREIESAPRLLFIIPEVFLGSAGAMLLIFSGLGITTLIRRKKT